MVSSKSASAPRAAVAVALIAGAVHTEAFAAGGGVVGPSSLLQGGRASLVRGREPAGFAAAESIFASPSSASLPLRKCGSSAERAFGGRVLGRASPSSLLSLSMSSAAPERDDVVATDGSGKGMKATDYFKPLVDGDILESTGSQRAIVGGAFVLLAAMALKGVVGLDWSEPSSLLAGAAAFLVGYEFADFGSGVYHWSMDNYGNKNTPIFGTQIEAFQGHHELPWTITYRQVCNNIYKICQATTPFCLAGLLLTDNPYFHIWMSSAIVFINMSQELHKWSHSSPAECHPVVNFLQDKGLIIGRKAHLAHHKPPFDGNYCIVSGHCNPALDSMGFFRWLEDVVYSVNGAEARCWNNERLLADTIDSLGLKKGTSTIARGTKTRTREE